MPVTAPTSLWETAGLVATQGGGRVDLAEPAAGLMLASGDHLLGVDLRGSAAPPRLVDHWVRGRDLVAVYEPADPRRLRVTTMWRAVEPTGTAWELVVSAQTALVESDAALAVRSTLAGGEPLLGVRQNGRLTWGPLPPEPSVAEGSYLLVRRAHEAIVVAVHPADAGRLVARPVGDRLQLDCWLFSTTIEKGVLLRSRVLAAIGPVNDTAWVDPLVTAFAASPPPLTT